MDNRYSENYDAKLDAKKKFMAIIRPLATFYDCLRCAIYEGAHYFLDLPEIGF
jgi:hypothetical protein